MHGEKIKIFKEGLRPNGYFPLMRQPLLFKDGTDLYTSSYFTKNLAA